MSLDQHAPTTVVLAASAPEQPNFGISVIPSEYDSQQVSRFLTLSGGLSTIRVVPSSFLDTLEALGVDSSELPYIDLTDHFGGDRVPDEAYLTYRGLADKLHVQTLTFLADTGTTDKLAVGDYRITDIEGGPYIYNSPGVAQVTDLEIVDAGGGDGATGKYTVSDTVGNIYSYESGGTDLWTVVVTVAAVGLYTVTDTDTAEVYSYTASGGDTIQSIRDGLLTDMNNVIAHPAGHPSWITNISGIDTITMAGATIGLQITFTSNLGPGAIEATLVETTPLVPETIGAIALAIDAVITGVNPPAPVEWSTSVAAAIVTCTAFAAFVGQDLGIKIAGPLAADATTTITTDHREDLVTATAAVNALITAAVHPSFVNGVASNVITLTGTVLGQAIVVAVSSPEGKLVLQETQSILTLRSSQTSRVTIIAETGTDAYLGGYTLSLLGENLMHTAIGGDSISDVRDALQLSVDTNLVGEATTVAVGTDAFDILMTQQGLPVTVTITSPGSNAGASASLNVPSYGAVDDFDRALDDEPDWYHWVGRGSDTDIQALTIHVDNIAAQNPRRLWFQVSDQSIPDSPSAVATDIAQFVRDTGTMRATVLWDPVPSSSVQDQQGMVHQWVGTASTFLPGQIQWNLVRLTGVSGGQKLTGLQEGTMRDKAAVFAEFIGSLGINGEVATNGPYTAAGRQQDIARAMDQIKFVYQVGAVALLANNAIVPYNDNPGIAVINATIQTITANLVNQGLVIEGSFRYLTTGGRIPQIADQTDAAKRAAGIFPEFPFQITIQVGGVAIPMFIEVTQ